MGDRKTDEEREDGMDRKRESKGPNKRTREGERRTVYPWWGKRNILHKHSCILSISHCSIVAMASRSDDTPISRNSQLVGWLNLTLRLVSVSARCVKGVVSSCYAVVLLLSSGSEWMMSMRRTYWRIGCDIGLDSVFLVFLCPKSLSGALLSLFSFLLFLLLISHSVPHPFYYPHPSSHPIFFLFFCLLVLFLPLLVISFVWFFLLVSVITSGNPSLFFSTLSFLSSSYFLFYSLYSSLCFLINVHFHPLETLQFPLHSLPFHSPPLLPIPALHFPLLIFIGEGGRYLPNRWKLLLVR